MAQRARKPHCAGVVEVGDLRQIPGERRRGSMLDPRQLLRQLATRLDEALERPCAMDARPQRPQGNSFNLERSDPLPHGAEMISLVQQFQGAPSWKIQQLPAKSWSRTSVSSLAMPKSSLRPPLRTPARRLP